jgi:hypothetical protein
MLFRIDLQLSFELLCRKNFKLIDLGKLIRYLRVNHHFTTHNKITSKL